jgi:hypothetical protein
MPMVMLQLEAVFVSRQDPGTRPVLADMEGDFDPILGTMSDVHDHRLASELHIDSVVGGHGSSIGVAAKRCQMVPEKVLRRLGRSFTG